MLIKLKLDKLVQSREGRGRDLFWQREPHIQRFYSRGKITFSKEMSVQYSWSAGNSLGEAQWKKGLGRETQTRQCLGLHGNILSRLE